MSRKNSKLRYRRRHQTPVKPGRRKERLNYLMVFISGAVIAGGAVALIAQGNDSGKGMGLSNMANSLSGVAGHRTVAQLVTLSDAELEQVDIAEMNLLCATGLPGAENLNIDHCLATLDQWAARVKHET